MQRMPRRDSERLGRSTFGSTSSTILGFSRQKALQKMSSAVGLPGLERLVKTTSRQGPQVMVEQGWGWNLLSFGEAIDCKLDCEGCFRGGLLQLVCPSILD